MAESQKKETPSAKSKEKSSLLDIDIGDDFFGSWKSMSMAGDGMDFDFGTTTKGKKKDFKFDKMDMDFSLDADFGKLPSFKTNMSDFDISSPIKKSGNSKEKSKEASSGGKQQSKRDDFAFSFDFDEFADLDFGSTKKKTEEKSDQSKDNNNNKEGYSNTSGSVEGSKDLLAKDVDALKDDDISSKDNDTQMENTSRNENDQVKSLTYESSNAEEEEIQTTVSSDKIISSSNLEEPTQESHLSEERSSLEPQHQKVVQDSSGQSLDNVSDLPEEDSGTSGKMVTMRSDSVKPMDEEVITKSSEMENSSAQMNLESQKREMRKEREDNVLSGPKIDDNTSKGDSLLESSMTNEEMVDKRNADSAPKLLMGSLDSGNTMEKERGNLSTRSKYFKKQNGSESEKQQAVVSSTKLISVANKRMGNLLPNNPPSGKREFGSKIVESGSKFAGISRPLPNVKSLPVQTKNTETSHASNNTLECLNAENIKPRTEPMSKTVGHDTKEEKEREQHTLHVNPLRSDVIPSTSVKQSIKEPSQKSLNPGMKSMGKIVVEKNHISPPKVSTLKVPRATELKLKPLNSMLPKASPSMRNKDQQKTIFKKNPSSVVTNKQTPSTPSLKRKTFEASAVTPTFTPSKRLSTSPFSNIFSPSSEKTLDKQVSKIGNHASMANEKSPRLDASALEIDIYSASENDALYQQAEACSKELDNICNMLKKKHDEAKDILVRAIVNNNNLLMLNHPIHQHKILMVQKFAASLSLH